MLKWLIAQVLPQDENRRSHRQRTISSNSDVLSVRLPRKEKLALQEISSDHGLVVSRYVARLLRQHLVETLDQKIGASVAIKSSADDCSARR